MTKHQIPNKRSEINFEIWIVSMLFSESHFIKSLLVPSLQSNIWKLSVISFLQWFLVLIPVLVVFYQQNGLSLTQVFLVQACFSITLLLCEIPSGYFADRVGRKKSIITGLVISIFGYLVYAFSSNFYAFMGAEIILAIGASFISGADTALLYETVLNLEKQKEYKKIEGRIFAFASAGEGFASILGGVLAIFSLRFPVYVQASVLLLALPIALSLKEARHTSEIAKTEIQSFQKLKEYLQNHHELRSIIIYGSILGSGTFTFVWFIQPYWKAVGVPLILFGILWAALQFARALFALSSHRLEKKLGFQRALLLFLILLGLGYSIFGFFQAVWAIPFMLIFYFIYGAGNPIFNDLVHQRVPSEIRATILSCKNFATRIVFIVLGPLVGFIADKHGLSWAFAGCGIFFCMVGGVSYLYMLRIFSNGVVKK